jgi:hypothetical protein
MHGTYIGPLEHLRGKSALLRKPPEESYILAQFDECNLTREKAHEPPERFDGPWPADSLGFGWHVFPRSHFNSLPADRLRSWRLEKRSPAPDCPAGHGRMGSYFQGWRCNYCGAIYEPPNAAMGGK